jgi:hypothetical protein
LWPKEILQDNQQEEASWDKIFVNVASKIKSENLLRFVE